MRSPADEGPWLIKGTVASTQSLATAILVEGRERVPGIVFAVDQTEGRGRFHRAWYSEPEQSLTMSLIYRNYADHTKPWLIGMAVSIAVAEAVGGRLNWPNDVVINKKKVGGILTELIDTREYGKVPVIGVGVNLNQLSFPFELSNRATSLLKETGQSYNALDLAKKIVALLSEVPEPEDWASLQKVWMNYDDTPGKRYRLPTGEESVAKHVGEHGELICAVNGEERSVLAAEALFGED